MFEFFGGFRFMVLGFSFICLNCVFGFRLMLLCFCSGGVIHNYDFDFVRRTDPVVV